MDAGLAGLLGGIIGAAVGALGATASAWITGRKAEQQAKIQSEAQLGQARLQIDAERTRALRESRKSAYLAFAESWHLVYGTLSEAGIKLGGIEASDPPEEREERRQGARHLWNEARALNRSLDRLQHVVHVEGPHQMGAQRKRRLAPWCRTSAQSWTGCTRSTRELKHRSRGRTRAEPAAMPTASSWSFSTPHQTPSVRIHQASQIREPGEFRQSQYPTPPLRVTLGRRRQAVKLLSRQVTDRHGTSKACSSHAYPQRSVAVPFGESSARPHSSERSAVILS